MTAECEIEIGEQTYFVEFERNTTFVTDKNYGADADGRRGVSATFVDEDEAEDIVVDGKPLAEWPEDFQKEVRGKVEEWMQNNDPEPEENDGPEHDD